MRRVAVKWEVAHPSSSVYVTLDPSMESMDVPLLVC